jgi:hypothetical protein
LSRARSVRATVCRRAGPRPHRGKLGYEPAPLVLAFVLGPMMENSLRKALIVSDGSFAIFTERPISPACLLLSLALLLSAALPALRARRERIAVEGTRAACGGPAPLPLRRGLL